MSLPQRLRIARLWIALSLLAVANTYAFAQQTAARPDRGVNPGGSYSVSDIETVNLQSGNVQLSIPLASLPPIAGGKLSFGLTATYNSKAWNITRSEQVGGALPYRTYVVNTPQLSDAAGWSFGGGYSVFTREAREDFDYQIPLSTDDPVAFQQLTQYSWQKMILRTPDGAEHELRPSGGTYPTFNDPAHRRPYLWGYYRDTPDTLGAPLRYNSSDGTYLSVVVNPNGHASGIRWTVFLPDGTQIVQYASGIQRIRDNNGNSIKIFSDANGAHYQDEQTGREILVTYNPQGGNGYGQMQVWYPTVGGDLQHVDINFGVTTIQGKIYDVQDWNAVIYDETGNQGVECRRQQLLPPTDLPVVREIILRATEPNTEGRRFTFSYNSDTTETANSQEVRWNCGAQPEAFSRTASRGLGALSHMETPSGAEVSYTYTQAGVHDFVGTAGLLNADHMTRETLTRKVLHHDGEDDEWEYNIPNQPNSTVSTIENPDGSIVTQEYYPTDPSFARSVGNTIEARHGLVFSNSNGVVKTFRHWVGSTQLATGSMGYTTSNPLVDAEYTLLVGTTLMSAKLFQHDFNGNVTQVAEYDWFDSSPVTFDGGVPTGPPAGATPLRVTNTSYYNSAPNANSSNFYMLRSLVSGTPSILNTVQQTAVGSAVVQLSYDGNSYGVAPTAGNLTSKSVWDNVNNQWITTSSTYGLYGNLATATDALGEVSTFGYLNPALGLPTSVIVDPQNGSGTQTTTTAYDDSTGLVTSVTDPNGNTSTISYTNHLLGSVDPFGRPGLMTGPDLGSGVNHTTRTFYEDNARTVTVLSDLNSEGDGLLKSQVKSDMLGRTIESRQYETATAFVAVRKTYDTPNRLSKTSNPFRASESVVWTTTVTDLAGRVVSVTTPDNAVVGTSYWGNTVTVTDQAGKQRKSQTDGLGRLVHVYEDPSGAHHVTSYAYDPLDNLTNVYQGSQTRTFAYDSVKRLTAATNPESGTIGYQYDNNGNLLVKTDARGVSAHYEYDGLNRLTRRWYNGSNSITAATHNSPVLPSGVGASDEVKYYYDSEALPTGAPTFDRGYPAGRLVATTYGGGSAGTYFGFDATGKPLRSVQQTGGINYQTTAIYNLAGAMTSMSYPSGHTVTNTHDDAGRLTSFTGYLGDGSQRTYATGITYSSFGGMQEEQFGMQTPLYHKLHYNVRGQLHDIRVSTVAWQNDQWNWNRGGIINYYSTPDLSCQTNECRASSGPGNNGNIIRQQHWVPANEQMTTYNYTEDRFTYDALNRLESVAEYRGTQSGLGAQDFAQVYDYDRWGNRTIETDPAKTWGAGINNKRFTVDPNTNRLGVPSGQSGTMSYDAAGNLTFDSYSGEGVRTYDAENKMTGAQASLPASYAYDGDGHRIKLIVNGVETWQVYGLGGELLAEYAANAEPSTPQKEYGYRNGELLVTAEAGTGGGGQSVSWTNASGVSVSGNNLTKTGASGWNAGAVSTQTISSGDGYMEFAATETNKHRMAGLSNGDSNQNYNDIDYSLYLTAGGTIEIYEGGTLRGSYGAYAAGDVVRVAVEGGVVKYRRNGTLLYTSTVTPAYPLVVDTCLYDPSATLTNIVLVNSAAPVGWTNPAGVSVSGNNLTKTGASGWNAGAASTQTITSGDGYMEFTATETNKHRMAGLSNGDSSQNYNDIDYSLYLTAGGTIEIYEGGTLRGSYGAYAAGDVVRVAVEGGVVKYRKNGTLLFSSTVTPAYPLLVDTCLYDPGATLTDVKISGASGGGSSSATVKWLVADQLGTPRMIFDQTGSLQNVSRHDYLPFGEELFGGPPSLPGVGGRTTTMGYTASDNVRQKFTSKERDNETGLDYFLARYYSSNQGRFTSPDEFSGGPDELYDFADDASENPTFYAELDNPQSLNKYQYTYNTPVNMTDEDGHCPICPAVAAAVEVIGTAADLYSTYQTWRDPNASRTEKLVVTTLTVGGAFIPVASGGGAIAKVAFKKAVRREAAEVATKRAVTAEKAALLEKAEAKGIPKDQLGGSGKPRVITKKLPTRKRAEDYQQARSKGPLEKDVNPAKGNTHYHPTRKDGSRRKGKQNVHIEVRSKKGRLPN